MACTPSAAPAKEARLAALIALAALLAAALVVAGPVQQDPHFHAFADTSAFGWAHFGNAVSNLAYAVVGIAGLVSLRRLAAPPSLKAALFAWSIGFVLVAAGSAWYHAAPSDASLIWDRAAMTVVFAAATAIYVADRISAPGGAFVLCVLAALGLWTQWYWAATGDLRPYRFVELLPFIVVPAICMLFPGRLTTLRHALAIIAVFTAATACEHFDREIAALLPVSGHTLKHLVSAAAGWLVVPMVERGASARPGTGSGPGSL